MSEDDETTTRSWVRGLLPGVHHWIVDIVTDELERMEARIVKSVERARTYREERDAALARAEKAERERDAYAEALTSVGIPDDYDTVAERCERIVREWGPDDE